MHGAMPARTCKQIGVLSMKPGGQDAIPTDPVSLIWQTSEGSHLQLKTSFAAVALGCIVLVCAALRIYHLGSASLWSDEIFSRYYADLFGLHYLLTKGLSVEATPPTYALLLRAWIGFWGGSEVALRSLSVVASILCVPPIYLLGRELTGKSCGLMGALLFAFCPMSLYFAQEARVYALFMLNTTIVLWAAAVFQRDPHCLKASILYIVFGTLGLYLHATGLLFIVACGGAVGISLLIQRTTVRPVLLKWTGLNALVLALGLPYFVHAFKASQGGGLDWIPQAGLHRIIYCVSLVVMGMVTPYPLPAFFLAAAVVIALVVSVCLHPPSVRPAVTLIGVPCLFLVLVIVVSLARPILLPRVLAWTVVPYCMIAGSQLLVAGRARLVVLLTIIASFGTGLRYQLTTPGSDKEPWRDALRTLAPEFQRADMVVLSPLFDPMVLSYYVSAPV